MFIRLPVVVAVLIPTALGALVGNWETCYAGDTCNSGYKCCVAIADVASGKRTCRTGSDCSSTSRIVGDWETCSSGDLCNDGYVCCLGKNDVSSGKLTCRLKNGDCVNLTTTRKTSTTTVFLSKTSSTSTVTSSKPPSTSTVLPSTANDASSPTSSLTVEELPASTTSTTATTSTTSTKSTTSSTSTTTSTSKTTTTTTKTVASSPSPSGGVLRGDWETCYTGDRCNSGYTCCVGQQDVSSGKKTCRLLNGDCSTGGGSSSGSGSGTTVNMPSGFRGTNTGIGSWFQANAWDSYTNGKSWCGYPYKDWTPGFAPDISVMTDWGNYVYPNPNWATSAQKYCGLEAVVTNLDTGASMTLYIADAFAHEWVRTPGSIDIMKQSFDKLYGRSTWNHNDVMPRVSWYLTGKRNSRYAYGGSGDP
ncbi:hypothetical protein HK098_000549 [Nowakowskiella sp. JEL0407]|nr:hypothetical protein HK098_000549 [Nowakowskiella sp. JEL0407]